MKLRSTLSLLFLALGIMTLFACTDEDGARRTLETAGYTDIVITGYEFWSCGDDQRHTCFDARGLNGAPVHGCVCSGLIFKNHTIRTE
jgi:hypothetical protein